MIQFKLDTKAWKRYIEGCPHGRPLTEIEWKRRFAALARSRGHIL